MNRIKEFKMAINVKCFVKHVKTDFSVYEKSFQRTLFDPLRTEQMVFCYDENMLKFCVSLLWRVVAYCDIDRELCDAPNDIKAYVKDAFIIWRKFLLGQLRHPGKYKQYVIILDKISNIKTIQAPEYFNTYILSACDMDICYAGKNVYIYAKIYNIYIISVLNLDLKNHFKVENIHVANGAINRLYDISLPGELVKHIYMRCAEVFSSRKLLSEQQQKKITRWVLDNKDELISSKTYKTFVEDLLRNTNS